MAAIRGVRARARAELTAEILRAARRQLAEVGAPALSVRAVARELGMVSSAVYRYFATRDELLTALIVEAYESVGRAAEQAAAADGRPPRERFVAACAALRRWAQEHPHEYALVYGSPVPGYQGDDRTTAAGSRVPLALLGVVRDARPRTGDEAALSPELRAQARGTADALDLEVPPEAMVRAVQVWTALFGLLSFELFGQLARTFDPADELFARAVDDLADDLGL
jgi:AcrR family transcriptional regulator